MKVILTDKIVSSYKWEGREIIVRDLELNGFFLAVGKSQKSFKIQTDINVEGERKTVRRTIGKFEDTSVSVARNMAQNLINQIKNPLERELEKPEPIYFSAAAKNVVRQKYAGNDRSHRNLILRRVDEYFEPWRGTPPKEITSTDAVTLLEEIRSRKGASSAKICARLLLQLHERDCLPSIKTARIRKFINNQSNDYSRRNSIPHSQLSEWHADVTKLRSVQRQNMHLFHLYSGLRPSLLVRIQRDWIRFEEAIICFPPDSIKSNCSREFPLSNQLRKFAAEAYEFSTLPDPTCKYLFPNSQSADRLAICRETKMMGRTGHVLQNTYISIAKQLGISDAFLRKSLGYVQNPTSFGGEPTHTEMLHFQNKISNEIDRYLF